jgi:hypothetical protein
MLIGFLKYHTTEAFWKFNILENSCYEHLFVRFGSRNKRTIKEQIWLNIWDLF